MVNIYPLSCHISYEHVSTKQKTLTLSISTKVYNQVALIHEWCEAMKSKLAALKHNNIWIIIPLPHDKNSVGYWWTYKPKFNQDETILHHKE